MIKNLLISIAVLAVFAAGVVADDVMFDDVESGAWYEDAAMWAADSGIMKGNGEMFRGGDNVTRAELATALMRFNMVLNGEEPAEEVVEEEEEPAEEEAAFAEGDAVYVQTTESVWHAGTVGAECDGGFDVVLEDETEECYDLSDIVMDTVPTEEELTVGTAVIADWASGTYYDAVITAAEDGVYSVEYYDGFTKDDLTAEEMILDPR